MGVLKKAAQTARAARDSATAARMAITCRHKNTETEVIDDVTWVDCTDCGHRWHQ